jgi:hypothetical protein
VAEAAPIEYDADTRMLAFAGTLALVVGTLFWVLVGLRLLLGIWSAPDAAAQPLAAVAFAIAGAGALLALASWGLRMKLQVGEPVTAWEMRRSMGAGLVVGVVIGFVVYVALAYKLKDPGFLTLAGEPAPRPPGAP